MTFETIFESLTGKAPFPWQKRLYDRFIGVQEGGIPASCNLPTGLGKTSVIAIWLIALVTHPERMPRRLVYVVNRRTVVDQTTFEVEKYRKAIAHKSELSSIRAEIDELRISTLRGQFADDGEWCEDPSRPAVICGTVDMIGSRLLFSGYGIGRARRPLHAGFLGQDTLLVHDEAHLEPAFQQLVSSIEKLQRDLEPPVSWPKLSVMELTATSQSGFAFGLDENDDASELVRQRIGASKRLFLHELSDSKKPGKDLIEKALAFKESGRAILVFAQSVETVLQVQAALEKAELPVQTLTGTMRGKEREGLVTGPLFARFLQDHSGDATPGTVYLICTSAGEVGVNMSADHLICDLTTFESMAQRLGRVNRFGTIPDCEVHVFYPAAWDEKNPLTIPRQRTLDLLRDLDGNASPRALGQLPIDLRNAAFAPPPVFLAATDMLFDAWALTTITGQLPGRPPVEPWLHGLQAEWEPPVTQVAWRSEVERLQPRYLSDLDREQQWPADRVKLAELAETLVDEYPLKPMELLSDRTSRVRDEIRKLASQHPDAPVWIVDRDGTVAVYSLSDLAKTEKRDGRTVDQISSDYCTILLPPRVGGLNTRGLLDAAATPQIDDSLDIADELRSTEDPARFARCRTMDRDDARAEGMLLIRAVPLPVFGDEERESELWYWFVHRNMGQVRSKKPVLLNVHVSDVQQRMTEILSRLPLDACLKRCLNVAARFHDQGKQRLMFQTMLGNRQAPDVWWAKSGLRSGTGLAEKYRHEFGSLHDLPGAAELELTHDERELVLHLIAAHHGRARPHFPADEVFDPGTTPESDRRLASQVPQRFGRLQRRFGRWGLAYLESLLRAADWSASAHPSQELEDNA